MDILLILHDFLLSTWLFSMTHDLFHIVINSFMLSFLLRFIGKVGFTRSVVLSFNAHFFSFILFAIIAISFFTYSFTNAIVSSEMSEMSAADDIFRASLSVGFVYACLQSFFLLIFKDLTHLRVLHVLSITWISNMVTALISYVCIVVFIPQVL